MPTTSTATTVRRPSLFKRAESEPQQQTNSTTHATNNKTRASDSDNNEPSPTFRSQSASLSRFFMSRLSLVASGATAPAAAAAPAADSANNDVTAAEEDAPRYRFPSDIVRRRLSRSTPPPPPPAPHDQQQPSSPSHHTATSALSSSGIISHYFSTALQEIIANKDTRQTLINALLEVKGEHIQKIRFVSCVDEFHQLPASRNKADKGRDICRFFIDDRALFKCTGIPERYVCRVMGGVYDDYAAIRAIFLEQLATNLDVQHAIDRIWLCIE